MRLGRIGMGLGVAITGVVAAGGIQQVNSNRQIVTGKLISPSGKQTEVGSFPVNMVQSPDGRYVVVSDVGFRQQLSVLDARNGNLVSKLTFNRPAQGGKREGLYFGLAFHGSRLYVGRGANDLVSVYDLDSEGNLKPLKDLTIPEVKNAGNLPNHVAGVALSRDGKTVFAVNNQSHIFNSFQGSLSAIDTESGEERWRASVNAFPLAVAANSDQVFVASERDGIITVVSSSSGEIKGEIKVGAQPAAMCLSKNGRTLFVTNSGSDTLSIIDVPKQKVISTILLRPVELRKLPGSTPLGLSLSGDEEVAFVAMGDLNAVAVVDLSAEDVVGYIDAGWYPTSTVMSADGRRLFVANAKGVVVRTPNNKSVRDWGQYSQDILEGTVSTVPMPDALRDLPKSTQRVLSNNRAVGNVATKMAREFTKPPIEHVVYIIKENRTYDQVLSDIPKGNGDPSLLLFGKDVTPNQHALAERFVLLDNFYVCAEVSADGWPWSTQGAINAYTARNVPYNYSGRGRNYDFEGTNNGTAVDMIGQPDVARHAGGFIWEAVAKKRLSYRNYGFFTNFGVNTPGPDGKPVAVDNVSNKKLLQGNTCVDFRRYDMLYADSEAWVKHGLKAAPRQLAEFGSFKDPSRVTTWLREFRQFEKTGKFPRFNMLRLGRDHTSGTQAGQYSPRACVADNDYAVGQIVEAISKSKFWNKTAIFILEDDAQAGFDHVDAHRSTAYVISPFIPAAKHDSRFYNTVSMLRTMGLLLGLEPHNQYLATANPIDIFAKSPVNPAPFSAILPSKEIVGEVNRPTAYRSADSNRLIDRFEEESIPDIELNDILWGHIKGAKTPRPSLRGARWSAK